MGERSRDDKTNSVSVFTFYQTLSREYQGSVEVYIDRIMQVVTLFKAISFSCLFSANETQTLQEPRKIKAILGRILHETKSKISKTGKICKIVVVIK